MFHLIQNAIKRFNKEDAEETPVASPLKGWSPIITLEKAFKVWKDSGQRFNFGHYCTVLRSIGYRIE